MVDTVAVVIAGLALVVSIGAVWYTRRTAKDTARQADIAEAAHHLASTPNLTVTLKDRSGSGPDILYEVRNDGSQDLDSVIVHRPELPDHIRYPVARLGTDYSDQAELGPLNIGEARSFLLCVGPSLTAPPEGPELNVREFQVRIICRVGTRTWPLSRSLEPRPPSPNAW